MRLRGTDQHRPRTGGRHHQVTRLAGRFSARVSAWAKADTAIVGCPSSGLLRQRHAIPRRPLCA